MDYRVLLKARVFRFFDSQSRKYQRVLVRALEELSRNPRLDNSKELDSKRQIYKFKRKKYRILYQIQSHKLIILVVFIGNRWDTRRFYKDVMKIIKKRHL